MRFFRDPDPAALVSAVNALRDVVPDYPGYGRCEYPHPESHEHTFEYEDAVDCLARELRSMVEPLAERVARTDG